MASQLPRPISLLGPPKGGLFQGLPRRSSKASPKTSQGVPKASQVVPKAPRGVHKASQVSQNPPEIDPKSKLEKRYGFSIFSDSFFLRFRNANP